MISFADLTDRKTVVIGLGIICLLASAYLSWYGLPDAESGKPPLPLLGGWSPRLQLPFRIVIALIGLATGALILRRIRVNLLVISLCAIVLALVFPHAILMWDPPSAMQTAHLSKQAADLDMEIYNNYLNKQIPWDPTIKLLRVNNRLSVFQFIVGDKEFFQLANIARWIDGFGLGDRFLQFIGMGWVLAVAASLLLFVGHYLPDKVPRPRQSRKPVFIGLGAVALLGVILIGRLIIANYHLYWAQNYEAQGLYQESLRSYDKALRWAPSLDNNTRYHSALGSIYYHTAMKGEADFYVYLGDQYFSEAAFRMAEFHYNRALEIRPDHPIARFKLIAAWLNIGVDSYNNGQYISARREWEKVLKIDPDNLHALYELAACHIRLSNYDLAVATLRKVIRLQRYFQLPPIVVTSQAYFRISWCLFQQGQYQHALEVTKQAVTLAEWD